MTYNRVIIPIVEGDGDEAAVPSLIRRVLDEMLHREDVLAFDPINAKGKPNLLKKVENFVLQAAGKYCHGILIIVDADEECPYEKAACMAKRVALVHTNVPVAIVYAKAEYETWFICSLSQHTGARIREILDIPQSMNAPDNIENISGAKGWLERGMPNDKAYKPTSHQKELTRHIDLTVTHNRSRSFRRLCHAIEELVCAMDSGAKIVTPEF